MVVLVGQSACKPKRAVKPDDTKRRKRLNSAAEALE
jgi:hypothetical protein